MTRPFALLFWHGLIDRRDFVDRFRGRYRARAQAWEPVVREPGERPAALRELQAVSREVFRGR